MLSLQQHEHILDPVVGGPAAEFFRQVWRQVQGRLGKREPRSNCHPRIRRYPNRLWRRANCIGGSHRWQRYKNHREPEQPRESRSHRSPGIKSAKDLRGKRFGIQSIGGGVWKTATVWLEHFGMDEKRDNIQMMVIGDVTILSQALETGLIDATVVPGFLSRRLAEKGFVVLGRCEETRLASVGMTVLVEKPYLQQNAETLQGVLMALAEGMVFITSAKHKPVVLETITKQFKLNDPAAAEGAYQDVLTLVRMEEYRKPYVSMDGLKVLQRLLKGQNPRIAELKMEALVDSTIVEKMDGSNFFEKLYAQYGVK